MTSCQDECGSLSGGLPKNLTLHWAKEYFFFLFTIRKRRSAAFQPLGGVPWFDLVEIYSQSFPQKTITMTMTMTPLNSTSEKMSCVFTSSKQHCSSPLKVLPYNSVGQLRFYQQLGLIVMPQITQLSIVLIF